MIDSEHALSIVRQAEKLETSRFTVYYAPRTVSDAGLFLMRHIDKLHLNYPFAGSRMLCDMLGRQGFEVGRRHVRTLMQRLGVEGICRYCGNWIRAFRQSGAPCVEKVDQEIRGRPQLAYGRAVSCSQAS